MKIGPYCISVNGPFMGLYQLENAIKMLSNNHKNLRYHNNMHLFDL